jgi:hypothetical protein
MNVVITNPWLSNNKITCGTTRKIAKPKDALL